MSTFTRDHRGYSLIELLMVVGITTVIAAMAVPMMSSSIGNFRLSGDAHSVASAMALAKLRAASNFSQARLFVDLTTRTFHVETLQKVPVAAWITEGGNTTLSTGVTFGFGAIASPPLNTQALINQAAPCVTAAGAAIANTACVLYNSRGIPVDPSGAAPNVGAPTGNNALYLTDGTAVYGLTLSATGQSSLYRTNISSASWSLQ
jgi:prepilin-type N-terminal cleavage/methylation domain-containing protein